MRQRGITFISWHIIFYKRCVISLLAGILACGFTYGKVLAEDSGERLPFPGYPKKSPVVTRFSDEPEPTVVSYTEYRDPLIRVNRVIFKFNDVTYHYLLIPLTKGYRKLVPDPIERGIRNFFYNIKTPVYAVNHLLQGKPKPFGRTLLRFGINTTIGLLGFFDPAKSKFNIKKEETHFENTLAHYGVDYGIYLVIPIMGPADIRRGVGSFVDGFLNPIPYFVEFPWSFAIAGFDNFQNFAPVAKRYDKLRRKPDDPYIYFRNLYLQGVQRDADY